MMNCGTLAFKGRYTDAADELLLTFASEKLHYGAFIFHHFGGLHKIWDGLDIFSFTTLSHKSKRKRCNPFYCVTPYPTEKLPYPARQSVLLFLFFDLLPQCLERVRQPADAVNDPRFNCFAAVNNCAHIGGNLVGVHHHLAQLLNFRP